jgi:putative (di)nucleoside polyphosphate hydrolase
MCVSTMSKNVDPQGYRPNVGMVIINNDNQVFWAQRTATSNWQFPQGGIHPGEALDEAMYRELNEEVGLLPEDVTILGQTEEWVKYLFDSQKVTRDGETYVGQKQIWFLLKLISSDDSIDIASNEHQEFDDWKWVDFWYPIDHIVEFKREVYKNTLKQFSKILLI